MNPSVEEQVRTIMFGSEFGNKELEAGMARELGERLEQSRKTGRPLRVYAGYDPSRPDLHLGHSITMRKLRQFQDFGHDVYFVVGTGTALVGDNSDKLTGRPRRTAEEVREAARTYADQCYRILDKSRTTVVFNGDWLTKLDLPEMISLASNFTIQQFLARDNIRRRLDTGDVVGLHEFLYPLLQGYDAYHLRADVQIGATEQLFNIQAGRKLLEAHNLPPCVCITYPILVGTDGVMRMSKSSGNYVGLAEQPIDQFGKIMSVSDATMLEWIKYITRWPLDQIQRYMSDATSGRMNPMELKKKLAWEIVSMYNGDEAADRAQAEFENVHQRGELPSEIELVRVGEPLSIVSLLTQAGVAASKSAARRLIDGGGVRIDGTVVKDQDQVIDKNLLLQVGKRRFFNVELASQRAD